MSNVTTPPAPAPSRGPRYPFRGRITSDGASGYPARPGRYHLYVEHSCPWAQRVAILRDVKGLRDVVGVSYVEGKETGVGWVFGGANPDPVNGFARLAEAYLATEPAYQGGVSVPVLWDSVTERVVCNHYDDITVDLRDEFDAYADPVVDLYPAPLRAQIDELNERIFWAINRGPYRVAGATDDETYTQLRGTTIAMLEELDARLAGQRYLFGAELADTDVRLWPTLVRFDLFYNPVTKVSERKLTEFPNLWGYARDLYQRPAFRAHTDFGPIAALADTVPDTFVKPGPHRVEVTAQLADWDAPHGRG